MVFSHHEDPGDTLALGFERAAGKPVFTQSGSKLEEAGNHCVCLLEPDRSIVQVCVTVGSSGDWGKLEMVRPI